MDHLVFCKDHVLRRAYDAYDVESRQTRVHLVPLKVLEKAQDRHAFLKSLNYGFAFEDGITVADIFENLAPWAELMTGVACMDFPAFLEEMRSTPPEPCTDVEEVVFKYYASIKAAPKYDREEMCLSRGGIDMGNPVPSGEMKLETGWHMNVMLSEAARERYEGETTIGMSFTPLSEWKHLPVRVDTKGVFTDETASDFNQAFLGTDQAITRADHPKITTRASNGRVFSHDIEITRSGGSFFDILVKAFFWEIGFFYTPQCRDEEGEELKARAAELDNLKTDAAEPPALEELITKAEGLLAAHTPDESDIHRTANQLERAAAEVEPGDLQGRVESLAEKLHELYVQMPDEEDMESARAFSFLTAIAGDMGLEIK